MGLPHSLLHKFLRFQAVNCQPRVHNTQARQALQEEEEMCFLAQYPALWIASLTYLFGPNAAGSQPEADLTENRNDAPSQSYLIDVLHILSADNDTELYQNQPREIIRMLLERTLCPPRIYEMQMDSNLVNVSSGERKNCTDSLARVKPSFSCIWSQISRGKKGMPGLVFLPDRFLWYVFSKDIP